MYKKKKIFLDNFFVLPLQDLFVVKVEVGLLVEAIVPSVFLSSEPNSLSFSSSLSISELADVDKIIVYLPSEAILFSVQKLTLINLS